MFANIQSSWLRNKNTCMGNWHSLFWGCSQILLNNDSHIVSNNYKQFDHVCGETVCAYWHWTHLLSNKYKQFHHVRGQTVCAYWSWTYSPSNKYKQSFTAYTVKLFVHIEVELTNKYKQFLYAVKLFVHIEVELTLFQTNTISLTLYVLTSPLSLWRDSFMTLDLNDFFSSTNAELYLSPMKIDCFPVRVSGSQPICTLPSTFL